MATTQDRIAVLAHPHELAELERPRTHASVVDVVVSGDSDDAKDEKIDTLSVARSDIPHQVTDTPLHLRLIALSMILFFTTGAAFAESTLGPLKSTFVKELKINNAQFASISTASNLVNTVLPLIGGTVMDYYGSI